MDQVPTVQIPLQYTCTSNVPLTTNMDPPQKPTTSLFDVYLRLRPSFAPNAERFLDVEASDERAPTHITIRPPSTDHRKRAVEKFAFTQVFEEDAAQLDLFKGTGMVSVIEGVLGQPGREGRDGLLATLGVTGSGKVGEESRGKGSPG